MSSGPEDTTIQPNVEEEVPLRGIRGALAAFDNGNFRLLWAGRVTSNMARQMRVFLRAWIVWEITDSPASQTLICWEFPASFVNAQFWYVYGSGAELSYGMNSS